MGSSYRYIPREREPVAIGDLLKPHAKALALATVAAVGAGIANLLEPWPLKIVLDHVLRSKPPTGWLSQFIRSAAGADKMAALKFAAVAVLLLPALHAPSPS